MSGPLEPPGCLPGCANGPFLPPWCIKSSFPPSLVGITFNSPWFLPPWCLAGCPISPFLPPWCLPSCLSRPFRSTGLPVESRFSTGARLCLTLIQFQCRSARFAANPGVAPRPVVQPGKSVTISPFLPPWISLVPSRLSKWSFPTILAPPCGTMPTGPVRQQLL